MGLRLRLAGLVAVAGALPVLTLGAMDSLPRSLQILLGLAGAALAAGLAVLVLDRSVLKPLQRSVDELLRMARQVQAASQLIAQTNSRVAEGAGNQAASLEEISATITELASRVKANAETAAVADGTASDTGEVAEDGRNTLYEMVDAMGRIKQAADETSRIITTIDEIAFQTNLLALNAAVEAVRAGDHGKGFSVVAAEVRDLAARSAEAARSSSELVSRSVEHADAGVTRAEAFVASLEEIVAGIDQLGDLSRLVATATEEQSAGLGQINQGVGDLDRVVQENAASSEETAASCQELSALSTHLVTLVQDMAASLNRGGARSA